MITTYWRCVSGFSECQNRTFTVNDFGATYSHEKTLSPGVGCFLNIDRERNGTFGKILIEVDDASSTDSILLFETQNYGDESSGLSRYERPMPYTNDGWLARTIFVVNIQDSLPAKFFYSYVSPFG